MRYEIMQALENLEHNQAAQEALAGAKDADELCAVLRQYDIELTEENMAQLCAVGAGDGPLDEETLDQVSGGMWLPSWLRRLLGRSNPSGGANAFGSGGSCGGR